MRLLFQLLACLGLLLALATSSPALAQPPPEDRPELALQQSASSAALVVPLVYGPADLVALIKPPRYDYRQAHKVERAYHRHQRYYRWVHKRQARQIGRANRRRESGHRANLPVDPGRCHCGRCGSCVKMANRQRRR